MPPRVNLTLRLKEVFSSVIQNLNEDSSSLKAVQKLLINSVGERDFSHRKHATYFHLQDFIVLSLDGSRAVEEHLEDGQPATAPSALDHYISRLAIPTFEGMILLHYVQNYSMPKEPTSEPSQRRKKVVIIIRPYCSPDPHGPKYEQYCRQKLRLHLPFRHQNELFDSETSFAAAYAVFLRSGNISSSLEDDICWLEQLSQPPTEEDNSEVS